MNARDFETLFLYDSWAMDRLLAAWQQNPQAVPDMSKVLAEGLDQDLTWLVRLTGDTYPQAVSPSAFADMVRAIAEMSRRFADFFNAMSPVEMGRTISVHEHSRLPFHLSMPMALTHLVFLHATRRDRMAALLQEAGIAVPRMDFMAFVLERGEQKP
ncbi:MAG: hypothetical protein A2018_00410 [Alphaproteobacteria bacterium GWF2_58_20]|nr:MAG: hypothetical protein A2018_00410 [Alphaproteobacteria bacterium GWF2_58_20]